MKTVSAALQTHLGQPNTTLAVLWKVTLLSGTVLAFTSFDKNIVYLGITYLASSGFLPSANDFNSDMSVDSLEVAGFLDNVIIKESDIRNGVYDYALVEEHIVNWQNLAQGDLFLRKGIIGNITMKNGLFTAEVRGLTQFLSTYVGSLYGPLCRAELYSTPTNNVNPGDHYFCYVKEADYQQNGSVGTAVDALHFVPGSTSPTQITWAGGGQNGGPFATVSTSAFNLVAGNSVVVAMRWGATAVNDTAGNTYTSLPFQAGNTTFTASEGLQFFYCNNAIGNANNVVTATLASGANIYTFISAWQISGGSLSVDKQVVGTGSSGTTLTTPSFNTAGFKSCVFAIGVDVTGFDTYSGAGGATFDGNMGSASTVAGANHKFYISGVQTGVTQSMTDTVSAQWYIVAAVFTFTGTGLLQKGSTTPNASAPANWFTDGELTFTSGLNNGFSFEIKTWDGTTLGLFLPMPFSPAPGDTFTIEPGCDKTPTATGCLKFQGYSTDGLQTIIAPTNILNFRGEPFISGNDLYYQFPDATTG